jgi:hypothetical protein
VYVWYAVVVLRLLKFPRFCTVERAMTDEKNLVNLAIYKAKRLLSNPPKNTESLIKYCLLQ